MLVGSIVSPLNFFTLKKMVIVGGQEAAKRALEEAVILPVLRPEVH